MAFEMQASESWTPENRRGDGDGGWRRIGGAAEALGGTEEKDEDRRRRKQDQMHHVTRHTNGRYRIMHELSHNKEFPFLL